jgi:flavin-dependent dehydrogenase
MEQLDVAVVGAGLAAAGELRRRGLRVAVFEAAPDVPFARFLARQHRGHQKGASRLRFDQKKLWHSEKVIPCGHTLMDDVMLLKP